MEKAAKVYLEAKDKNDKRTLDKLKNRFDGFQKIEDFITKKNQEQENAASLAAIQAWCSQRQTELFIHIISFIWYGSYETDFTYCKSILYGLYSINTSQEILETMSKLQ